MTLWTIHAAYDPEALVWYTVNCDIPGLITEGDTLERFRERAAAVAPELIADNAHLLPKARRRGPHALRVIAPYQDAELISI